MSELPLFTFFINFSIWRLFFESLLKVFLTVLVSKLLDSQFRAVQYCVLTLGKLQTHYTHTSEVVII